MFRFEHCSFQNTNERLLHTILTNYVNYFFTFCLIYIYKTKAIGLNTKPRFAWLDELGRAAGHQSWAQTEGVLSLPFHYVFYCETLHPFVNFNPNPFRYGHNNSSSLITRCYIQTIRKILFSIHHRWSPVSAKASLYEKCHRKQGSYTFKWLSNEFPYYRTRLQIVVFQKSLKAVTYGRLHTTKNLKMRINSTIIVASFHDCSYLCRSHPDSRKLSRLYWDYL